MASQKHIQDALEELGVFTSGHFVFASGLHGDTYINKNLVFTHPNELLWLTRQLAVLFGRVEIDIVVGPEKGGIVLAPLVALHLGRMIDQRPRASSSVRSVFVEKDGDGFVFKRSFGALVTNKNVLIVEDIMTTGGSVAKTIAAVRKAGGTVVGVGALVNRGGVTGDDILASHPPQCLLDTTLPAWEPDECPLCRDGVPVNTDLGHGRAYLDSLQKER